MSRFTTGTRTIPTRTLGDQHRPTITDTEKGQTATFIPGTDVTAITTRLNAATEAPGRYHWQPEEVIDDEVHRRSRRIAAEADARIVWTLPLSWVIDMVAHDIIPNGVPVSGDHRRFAARLATPRPPDG